MAKEETKKKPAKTEKPKKAETELKKPRAKKTAAESKPPARSEARSEERRPEGREEPAVVEKPVEAEAEPVMEDFPIDPKKPDRYFESVGRRKTSVARVRLYTRAGDFTVNQKPYGQYFPTLDLQTIAEEALQKMKLFGRFRISAKISGGGTHSQAEALRHGLARALIKFNPDFRKRLKRAGYLKRDPRAKERKKFGLKKARRAPQWSKR